jgi:SAM-dependent methyltransferase
MADYTEEVARIRKSYEHRVRDPEWQAVNNCLANPEVADYRAQQFRFLSHCLWQSGASDVARLRFLEVGCGSGNVMRLLAAIGARPEHIVGVDIRPEAVSACQSSLPGATVLICDGVHIPCATGAFDVVLQSMCFMNLGNAEMAGALASEMLRCLVSGGHVWWWDTLCTLPEFGGRPITLARLFPGIPVRQAGYARFPRPSECLSRRRWRLLLGWLADRLGWPQTHVGALIGPRP